MRAGVEIEFAPSTPRRPRNREKEFHRDIVWSSTIVQGVAELYAFRVHQVANSIAAVMPATGALDREFSKFGGREN